MRTLRTTDDLDALDFARGDGTVCVVAQDARTGAVLMVAGADRDALERTLATGEMHYRSRRRGSWHKGATSGNIQRVVSLTADCDRDTVLALVSPAGPTCHSGEPTCFGDNGPADALGALDRIIADRSTDPTAAGHTRRLLGDRNLRLKKLGEECAELAVACADGDRARAVEEAADLMYHVLVALRSLDAGLDDVRRVLCARRSAAG